MTLLIYDDEQEGSPKYFKRMLVDFMEKRLIIVILWHLMNLLTLLTIYNGNKTKVLNEVEINGRCFFKAFSKRYLWKDFENDGSRLSSWRSWCFLDDIITDYQKMADMNNEVVRLSEENNKLKKKLKNWESELQLHVLLIISHLLQAIRNQRITT